ncbi:Dynactin [Penicillium chermesinum]|nr:Dynactin [Penicillium chermesinum]
MASTSPNGTNGVNGANSTNDSRPVFFFDIDNCVHKFFVKHLNLTSEDAHMLHQKYYKEYGLAIEGLTRHHKIDPLEFNREVDDALPLDNILKPDPKLRKLLERLDTSKVKPWLLTNAYITHGNRVIRLLGLEGIFEGITYCDYGQLPLVCKPSQAMYAKAEKEAGAPSTDQCYFVDDSHLNCTHAQARGWCTVHLVEKGQPIPRVPASRYLISSLEELPISPGSVITLTDGRQGTIRFIGTTHFAVGDWIGVELKDATGKNDGAVQGERYFTCEAGHGMFVRPTAVASVLQQPARESKQTARPGSNPVPGRQSISAGSRKPGTVAPSVAKRQSINSATPTPAPRTAPRSSLRSPTKSPTKQLSSTAAPARPSVGGPRTSTVGSTRPRPAPSTRSSVGGSGTSTAASRTSRPSVSGPAAKISRPGSQAAGAPVAAPKRLSVRQNDTARALDSGDTGASGPSEGHTDADSGDAEEDSPEDEEATSAPPAKPARTSMAATRTAASRTGVSTAAQRQAQNNANNRELEELQAKLRIIEKKRAEDRDKLKVLEQLQTERDKFESIIQKLQAKYQPQQLEITELRRKLKDTEAHLEQLERVQAEHESLMEMATLDREMAEETAEALKHDCEALRSKMEELELEVDVLREENAAFDQDTTPEDRSSYGWLQMEKTNERLREALIRLRDMTQQQEAELKDQIKELEDDLEEYSAVKSEFEATKEKLLVAETNVDDLKQQLETALGAEEMIEELADKNMRYQEEINELKAAIEDLEALKEISDELEYTHIETEKQLQEEIDYRDGVFSEQTRKIAQQDEVIEDLEYTLSRFRELVTNLQSDLEDMRASQQISEAEATDLTTRSRAMIDLNMKLQASVSKAQTKSIDVELNRMESEEATQHLAIVKLYLPEYYDSERNSVLALLRFKRVTFKATVVNNIIRERISEQSSITSHEEIFSSLEALEHLLWISAVCDRFVNFINACSVDQFSNVKIALVEMEPVERMLNFWIENFKKNEVNMKKFDVHCSVSPPCGDITPETPETFADALCMKAALSQSYLDHAATAVARLKSLVDAKLSAPGEDSEENALSFEKLDAFVSQARGFKVAMGKIYRAVEDLRSRSLALSDRAAEPFKNAESFTRDLSDLTRKLGEAVLSLTSEEGREEPAILEDVFDSMSRAAAAFAQDSESATEANDPVSLLSNKLRDLGTLLEELDAISNDLSQTTEFERGAHPWIARSSELKSNKTISPDADEEIRRLKNEIHEVSTALGVKDNTLEEQGIKIELLESRMKEASKKASMVKDLEVRIEELRTASAELQKTVDEQKKELQTAENERDDYKTRLERLKRASGTAGAGEGVVIDNEASLAAVQENESLRAEVASLQSAVRFLREENRRSNLLNPYSVQRSTNMHAWLDAPLTQTNPTTEQEKMRRTALESRDVFTHLLKLTKESRITDLRSTFAASDESEDATVNRTAWRPAKSRLRYQVLQQRENLEHWKEWRDDIVEYEREQDRLAAAKRERALRDRMPKHAHKGSVEFPQGLGHGMMGRAWQILGMQNHRKTGSMGGAGPDTLEILSSD